MCEAENTPNLGIEPEERRTPFAIGRGGPVVATMFTSNGCAINVLLCTKSRWHREYVTLPESSGGGGPKRLGDLGQ